MNGLLVVIAEKLFDLLAPKIGKLIEDKMTEWLPKIMKACVVAISQAAGQLTVNTADKVTDVIPGKLDDQIVDPIVKDAWDFLHSHFGV